MLSVWHIMSQEELKLVRPGVILRSRAGMGVPRTEREGERERERERRRRRRRRGMEIGCMFFVSLSFFF